MFPNPQDALPLPASPNLNSYKKTAKELIKAHKSSDSRAIEAWAQRWIDAVVRASRFQTNSRMPVEVDRWVREVAEFGRNSLRASGTLANAQFVIARVHGFESWPKFAKHVDESAQARSATSNFESAADAIVCGDINKVTSLLQADPGLIHARSARQHRATLLHYVSANGVEGYRQKTPANIVAIAKLLLNSGAEVDAEADVYGGGATTLYLAATSIHPERAGVHEELMQLLIDHGAEINRGYPGIVNVCLANGRRRAAEFLAARGADLDLEAAAGLGNLQAVRSHFSESRTLIPPATRQQLDRGFLWTCEYGHNSIVEFLLNHNADLQTQSGTGQTPLHWAVIGGQVETIKLLLQRGAEIEARNMHDASPLGQALWLAVNAENSVDYVSVIKVLLQAGAQAGGGMLDWLAQQKRGSADLKKKIAEILRARPRV